MEGGEMAKKGGAPENLKPVRTKDEAKKRGKNGGIKSGEARRRKRDAQAAAKLILSLPCGKAMETNLRSMLVEEEDFTNRVALFARAFAQAMTGDVKAMEFIVKIAGETPDQELDRKRFANEVGQQQGSNNAVDDWVNSIPDIETEEENEDGVDSTTEKT